MHSKFLSSKINPNDTPFDKNGYCNTHSDVQLAKKDKNSSWKVIQSSCSECNETNKLPRSTSSSNRRKDGQKVSRAIKQMKVAEKANQPSGPSDVMNIRDVPSIKGDSNNVHATKSIALSPKETALVQVEKGSVTKHLVDMEKGPSNASLTSATHSPDSEASHMSPAFSSTYFSGTKGFPALPLISDELNISYADTVKHSNALVATKSMRSKPRTAVPSAHWLK
jgi:hypothetical protein